MTYQPPPEEEDKGGECELWIGIVLAALVCIILIIKKCSS
jgi:hypothetical protein